MAGRKKPTALKRAEGNPGKRPLPKGEPAPTGKAVAPKSLTPKARTVWRRLAPKLDALGVLTDIDVEVFERYCETQVRWRVLNRWLQTHENCEGVMRIHAKATLANRLSLEMLKFECEFGMTPASRTRIAVSAPRGETESIEDFAARKPLAIVKGA